MYSDKLSGKLRRSNQAAIGVDGGSGDHVGSGGAKENSRAVQLSDDGVVIMKKLLALTFGDGPRSYRPLTSRTL